MTCMLRDTLLPSLSASAKRDIILRCRRIYGIRSRSRRPTVGGTQQAEDRGKVDNDLEYGFHVTCILYMAYACHDIVLNEYTSVSTYMEVVPFPSIEGKFREVEDEARGRQSDLNFDRLFRLIYNRVLRLGEERANGLEVLVHEGCPV